MSWPRHLAPPHGVLFDLDGVIVHSGPAHAAAWTALFAEQGIHFDRADYEERAAGRPRDAVIMDVLGVRPDHDRLMQRKVELMQTTHPLPLVPGTMDFVRALHLPYAIATSSRVPGLLLDLAGVRACFSTIVHRGQVAKGKPAPDLFLEAADRLGVHPTNALVIEDAPAGVEAGLVAGCTVVGLGDPQRLHRAHLVVPRLPLSWLADWVGRSR